MGARAAVHAVLIGYSLLALGPAVLIVANSFKERSQIFDSPFSLPTPSTWDTSGYRTVFDEASFPGYFRNSLVAGIKKISDTKIGDTLTDEKRLATEPLPYPLEAVLGHLATDKKHASGRLRWVLPTASGTVVRDDVDPGVVERAASSLLAVASPR